MDNWPALFDGQNRYILMINDSPVKPDVLRFRGREALSEPFSWRLHSPHRRRTFPGTGTDEICDVADAWR